MLKFIKRIRKDSNHRWYCQYKCHCGNLKIIRQDSVSTKNTRSCGCLYKTANKRPLTHGLTCNGLVTAEYTAWAHAKSRCYKKTDLAYKYYGERGIRMCDRWKMSFVNFLADMGRKPTPQHSIDRIDVNGNYEPDNCRWATALQQRHNRRDYEQ